LINQVINDPADGWDDDMKSLTAEQISRGSSTSGRRLSLHDRLGLIGLIDEGMRIGSADSPIVADLFSDLWDLVDRTVSGSKLDRLKSEHTANGFKVIEVNGESGENLGRLNMLYLNKPIPCYYLVYVEVAAPFRNKGLGSRILEEMRAFLTEKSAVGILDNIIPRNDPTFHLYAKQHWQPIEEIIGPTDDQGVYMVFVPPSLRGRNLKEPVRRLLYHLQRKRAAIDMRDNEQMVARTIEEFKELYGALLTYFEQALAEERVTPLMQFMFTRYVTKLLGFRRRIGQLLGYTGGESLEQIVLDPVVRALPIQSYAPRDLASNPAFVSGDRELWLQLPEVFKKHPARMIESLPNYRRPSLLAWLETNRKTSSDALTIGDLMDLGFDPTRLKEINLSGVDYIFERVHPRLLPDQERKKQLLEEIEGMLAGERVRNASVKTNPPLLIIRDRGNGYILRRKVEGIHWEEAVEQLQTQPGLKTLNSSLRVDKMIAGTVRRARVLLSARLEGKENPPSDLFTFFVSWNLETNQPRIAVDPSGSFLESIWFA